MRILRLQKALIEKQQLVLAQCIRKVQLEEKEKLLVVRDEMIWWFVMVLLEFGRLKIVDEWWRVCVCEGSRRRRCSWRRCG